ncbi:MAG: hypothetical protein IJ111_06840 [Eggerthellaceae bacterium]|nr:hypothetical protein [Eggerthellaceae bacterium]
MVGEKSPNVYLEFPLIGKPFLDVTVLPGRLSAGTRIDSPAAVGTESLLEWAVGTCCKSDGVCFGFELDVKESSLPTAAVHFQHFARTDLVAPFLEAIDEPERAESYLGLSARMPKGWPLATLGLFRGRPHAPLRASGYLNAQEKATCAEDPARLAVAFDTVGFTAYDSAMIERASELLRAAPGSVEFQFDVFGDGKLGPTFAFDVQFAVAQPDEVRASFAGGPAMRVLGLLESWGVADKRWRLAGDAAFARAIGVELDNGSAGRFAFTLMPQWAKARWTNCEPQPSKLYHLAKAELVSSREKHPVFDGTD